MLVGTGTGKAHPAIATARICIRSVTLAASATWPNLVNGLEIETRNGRQGWLAEHLPPGWTSSSWTNSDAARQSG